MNGWILVLTLAIPFFAGGAWSQEERTAGNPLDLQSDLEFLATVHDSDGFANLRAGPSAATPVVGTLRSGVVVSLDEFEKDSGNWIRLSLEESRVDSVVPERSSPHSSCRTVEGESRAKVGWIHRSRLRNLSRLAVVETSRAEQSSRRVRLRFDSLEFGMDLGRFKRKGYRVVDIPERGTTLDRCRIWGMDGSLPYTMVSRMFLVAGSDTLSFDPSQTRYLFQVDPGSIRILAHPDGGWLLYGEGGDASGSYVFVFHLKNRRIEGPYLFVSFAA